MNKSNKPLSLHLESGFTLKAKIYESFAENKLKLQDLGGKLFHVAVIWGSDYACTPDHGVTCSHSSDMINRGNFLHFPSLAQQTPKHTTSRHSFLNELPCQRRPSLPDFGRGCAMIYANVLMTLKGNEEHQH